MHRLITSLLATSIVFYGTPAISEDAALNFADSTFADAMTDDQIDFDSPWQPVLPEFLISQATYTDPTDPTDLNRDLNEASPLDAEIALLEDELYQISTRGPRSAAVFGGIILVAGGVVAVAAALACSQADSNSGTRCRKKRASNIKTGGGIAAGVGLVTLIGGLITLGSRKQQQRNLDQRIQDLREERDRSSKNFEANVSLGKTKMLTLSWSF